MLNFAISKDCNCSLSINNSIIEIIIIHIYSGIVRNRIFQKRIIQ